MNQALREQVYHRDAWCCVRCGRFCPAGDRSVHHRTARGMGGSSDPAIDRLANLLLLCGSGTTGCHGWTESYRTPALAAGFLVPRGTDPATVPVLRYGRRRMALTDTGWAAEPDPAPAVPADVF